jgi:predicted HAD superfamily Cof-like phosphohydrolase
LIPYRYHWTPVVEFHTAFGHPVRWAPEVPPLEERKLRVKLILEEVFEFIKASGFELIVNDQHIRKMALDEAYTPDEIDVADALADIKYVTEGAALCWGIPMQACFLEVHRSNMAKLGPDGRPILREDGKILKPEGWSPPNLGPVIQRMLDEQPYESQEEAAGE